MVPLRSRRPRTALAHHTWAAWHSDKAPFARPARSGCSATPGATRHLPVYSGPRLVALSFTGGPPVHTVEQYMCGLPSTLLTSPHAGSQAMKKPPLIQALPPWWVFSSWYSSRSCQCRGGLGEVTATPRETRHRLSSIHGMGEAAMSCKKDVQFFHSDDDANWCGSSGPRLAECSYKTSSIPNVCCDPKPRTCENMISLRFHTDTSLLLDLVTQTSGLQRPVRWAPCVQKTTSQRANMTWKNFSC